MDEDQNLLSVNERLKLEQQGDVVKDLDSGLEFTGNELASMNFWICKPSIFDRIENDFREFLKDDEKIRGSELYIPFVIQDMLQDGEVQVKVFPSGGEWFGVTYADDKEKDKQALVSLSDEGAYPSPLWNR